MNIELMNIDDDHICSLLGLTVDINVGLNLNYNGVIYSFASKRNLLIRKLLLYIKN